MKSLCMIVALVALSACQKEKPISDTDRAIAALESASLTNSSGLIDVSEADHLRSRVADLEKELAATKRETNRVTAPNDTRVVASSKPRKSSMCYKDYCPCSGPQEGMDSLICDQLEAGVNVPVETMIAGRGGREYRRQAAEIGF